MEGFRQFFEAERTSDEMRERIRKMFADGFSKRNIYMKTGVKSDTIEKILSDFKLTKDVQPVAKNIATPRFPGDANDIVKDLHNDDEEMNNYQTYKKTGISYHQMNKALGITGPGAPRKLTDEQKAKIVTAAVKLYYNDSQIAKMLGIKNRANITRIIAPYLTPEIIAIRKERQGIPPDRTMAQIPPFPGYKNPEPYIRPVSLTKLPNTRILHKDRTDITGPDSV